MKVIEGKHYPKDGPECSAIGYRIPTGGHEMGCPMCRGTAVKAVEDWTDAVKAEWLAEHSEDVWIHLGNIKKWVVSILEAGAMNSTSVGIDSDFSAALTAAVIAVAEEAECDSGK